MSLTPHESRILGVLVEKAHTVQSQYPLSLNALVTGSNQRNNREPVLQLTEVQVETALDGLRAKGLAREVDSIGARVVKYRHVAREGLGVGTSELVLLAELLLRGPQTAAELRSRASRMHPIETLDAAVALLEGMAERETPLVRRLPGGRAERWVQLLSPDLHAIEEREHAEASAAPSAPSGLAARVTALEEEVARLRAAVAALGGPVHAEGPE